MELPDIGAHCTVVECNRLDFLPFTCGSCSKIFCLDHRSPSSHTCLEINQTVETLPNVTHKQLNCCLKDCQNDEMKVKCDLCRDYTCLKHRHPEDHNCAKHEQRPVGSHETPVEKVERIVGHKLTAPKKGKSKSPTALKVMMMKLKMKAIGDQGIPQTERVYFTLLNTTCDPVIGKPIFLNKTWKVGKCIDNIATLLKLKNENHLQNSKKLRLYGESGTILPADILLETLLNDETPIVTNCDEIEIRYV